MQRLGPQLLLSATDLVNFHECGHLTALDPHAMHVMLGTPSRTRP
jgi:hypothetical protein